MRAWIVTALWALTFSAAFAQPPAEAPRPSGSQADLVAKGGILAPGPLVAEPQAQAQVPRKQGSQAARVLKGETLPAGPLVTTPPAPIDSLHTFELNRAADARVAVKQGKHGPFLQAKAAFEDKDGYALGWALATVVTWAVGGLLGLYLIVKVVAAIRRH